MELKGEFTNYSPLAVSDAELKECLENPRVIPDDERKKLIEEYDALPDSQYYQLRDGHVKPLTQEEITQFILQQITAPMKMSFAVGSCMGNAPFGWPRTDSFFIQQIENLVNEGILKIEGESMDIMNRIVKPTASNNE